MSWASPIRSSVNSCSGGNRAYLADGQQPVQETCAGAADALVTGATISTTAATVPVKTAAILRMMFSKWDGRRASM
jgi:hypothetical protein